MGVADHRGAGRDDRSLRPPRRREQARLLPPRLRIFAFAQRRDQYACGKLYRRGHRRVALRRRRRLSQQRRDLPSRCQFDRGHRPARRLDPHARPIAHRRHPHRRRRRVVRRTAGHRDADPEHQPGFGRARSGDGEARLCPRRSVHVRARAVHDRHRQDGGHHPARHDVRRARRLLHGRRQPIHSARTEADRTARRMPVEPRGDLRAWPNASAPSIRAST